MKDTFLDKVSDKVRPHLDIFFFNAFAANTVYVEKFDIGNMTAYGTWIEIKKKQ